MSERIFGWLLKLYPRRFRGEYGDAMRQLWRDRLRAETGSFRRLRLWIDLVWDLATSVPREYRRRSGPASTELAGYRMSEAAVNAMVGRSHSGQVIWVLLSLAAGAALGWLGNAPKWPLAAVYGLLMLFAAAPLRGMRSFKDHWRRFELVLDQDCMRQMESGKVTKVLRRTEIARIQETIGMGMAVQTQDPYNGIWVPSVLNGYQELRAQLADWAPVEQLEDDRHGGHLLFRGALAIYPAALLARLPYCAVTLAALAAAYLSYFTVRQFASETLQDGTRVRPPLAARLVPLGLIALLMVKLAFVMR